MSPDYELEGNIGGCCRYMHTPASKLLFSIIEESNRQIRRILEKI